METECRFNFPGPPSERTFITQAMNSDVNEADDPQMQIEKQHAKQILLSVWEKIQDPSNDFFHVSICSMNWG